MEQDVACYNNTLWLFQRISPLHGSTRAKILAYLSKSILCLNDKMPDFESSVLLGATRKEEIYQEALFG